MVEVSFEVIASLVVAVLFLLSGVIGYLYNQVRQLERMVETELKDLWRYVDRMRVEIFGHEEVEGGGLRADVSEVEDDYEGLKEEIKSIRETVDDIKDVVNGDYNDED